MPRTREQLQKAVADTEAWLDQLNPETIASPESSAEDLRAIGEALHAVAASDLRLADEVTKARANGRTWTQIAAVLGVSKQAVAKKYGTSSVAPVVPAKPAANRASKPHAGQWLILTPGGRTLLRVAKGPR